MVQGELSGQVAAARTVGDALALAVTWLRLDAAPDGSPSLDAQLLLAHATGVTRTTLLAFPERELATEEAARYAALIAQRAAREPVAYLIGQREFMGLSLRTDRRALIPRPETELLVEAALRELRARLDAVPTPGELPTPPIVADIGTGSGAIILAIAALEPRLPLLYATDISADALALAAENAHALGLGDRVRWLQGDLLEPLPERVDVLLANLPYVAPRDATTLPADVRCYEPALALYGAGDGLGHLRRFFAAAPASLRPGAALLVEFGYDQRTAVEALARATFHNCTVQVGADYAGWERYALVRVAAGAAASEPVSG